MRADKFLFRYARMGRRPAREAIAAGRLVSNGIKVSDPLQQIGKHDEVLLDSEVLQSNAAVYLMLHKPKGVVCATSDSENTTVIDLIEHPQRGKLHLAGRLDKNTSGLVLLTNDGLWSRFLTEPSSKKPKTYMVTGEGDFSSDMLAAFRSGIFFEKEQVTTHPAVVKLISNTKMELTIFEGMHHQIKRMFLKFGNRVVGLHRTNVGGIELDIAEGEWRELRAEEIKAGQILDSKI